MLQVPKMVERIVMTDLKSKRPASKYAGLGAAIAAELMNGFWFGVGVILAVGVVDGLNHCAGALTSGKCGCYH